MIIYHVELEKLREELAASQRREQEWKASREELAGSYNRVLARLAAAEALIPKWRYRHPESDMPRWNEANVCAQELERALSANGEAAG